MRERLLLRPHNGVTSDSNDTDALRPSSLQCRWSVVVLPVVLWVSVVEGMNQILLSFRGRRVSEYSRETSSHPLPTMRSTRSAQAVVYSYHLQDTSPCSDGLADERCPYVVATNKVQSDTRSLTDDQFGIRRLALLSGVFSIRLFTDIVTCSGHRVAVEEPSCD